MVTEPTTLQHVVIPGDCLSTLRSFGPDTVDAIVTDPPYGLGFMGKAWDDLPPGLASAALAREGFVAVGIEREADYLKLIEARMAPYLSGSIRGAEGLRGLRGLSSQTTVALRPEQWATVDHSKEPLTTRDSPSRATPQQHERT